MTTKLVLGDNVSIGAGSLVNQNFPDGNVMIAGMPAKCIKATTAWYISDKFAKRVEAVEKLKKQMNINL